MNELNKLIEKLISEKGGSRKDYLTLLNAVAYHESAGTLDPTIKQIGGGPGRGKYQFEVGKNAGGITAARRAKQYYQEKNIPVPEWLQNATSTNDLDVSNLSSEQQDILFLANMRKHPKADLENVIKEKESIPEFWANYHWAGPEKEKNKKIEDFKESIKNFNPETIIQQEEPKLQKFNNFNINIPDERINMIKQRDVIPENIIQKAMGGDLGLSTYKDKNLNRYDVGGTHEQNPYGGIPQGTANDGRTNTVEEGETSFELTKGKYIFSNRLVLGGNMSVKKGNKMKDLTSYSDGGDLKNDKKIIGPQLGEDPLKFTKSENQYLPDGSLKKVSEEFVVEDVRDKYIYPEYISPGQNVDFNLAVKDKSAQEFLNRYNDPWTRSKLKEQANLSDEDIDNMILRGLNVKKELGGVDPKFKAKYDSKTGTINMNPKFDEKEGVETHERVHASLFDAAQGDNLMKILGNPFRQETKTYLRDKDPNLLRYMQKPHEAYGNFTEFREKLGLKPGQKINKEELKKIIKSKNLSNENFIRVFDDDKVVEALNTIASVDTRSIEEYRIS